MSVLVLFFFTLPLLVLTGIGWIIWYKKYVLLFRCLYTPCMLIFFTGSFIHLLFSKPVITLAFSPIFFLASFVITFFPITLSRPLIHILLRIGIGFRTWSAIFFVRSDLNGNCGSWTNSDDTPKNQPFGRRRGKADTKSETIRYAPRPPGKPKNQEGSKQQSTSKETETPETEEISKPQWPNAVQMETVYGDYLLRDGSNYSQSSFPFIDPGDLEQVHFTSPYMYFAKVEIPGFNFGRVTYQKLSCLYLLELVALLNKELKICSSEKRNQEAVLTFLVGKFPSLDKSKYLIPAARVFLFESSHLRITEPEAEGVREFVAANTIPVYTFMDPLIFSDIDATKEPDYCYNHLWNITAGKGFQMESLSQIDQGIYPAFETIEPKEKQTRWLCEFTPSNQFVVYRNSATNACSALARYFKGKGAPEEEKEYQINQLALLNYLPPDVLEEFNSSRGFKIVTAMNGRRYLKRANKDKTHSLDSFNKDLYIPDTVDPCMVKAMAHLTKTFSSYFCYFILFWLILKSYLSNINSFLYGVYYRSYNFGYQHYDKFVWLDDVVERDTPKRKIYFDWHAIQQRTIKFLFGTLPTWKSRVKHEIAKPGKYARLYGSSEEFCLFDPITPEFCKKMFSFPYHPDQNTSIAYYDVQEPTSCDLMYSHATQVPNVLNFFSDDGFVKLTHDDQFYLFETDIASCDTSNGYAIQAIAYYLLRLVGGQAIATHLTLQIFQPTILVNPDNENEFVKLTPVYGFEYSGCVLTTLLNNIASFLIMTSIYDGTRRSRPTAKVIRECAKKIGYELEVVLKHSYSSVTFLKRAYDGVRSFKCLGTILRSFGKIEEYTPRQFGMSRVEFNSLTPAEVFERYGHQVVSGLVNEPGNQILDALRIRFKSEGAAPYSTPQESLETRYGITQSDIAILVSLIESLKLGDIISCHALNMIFKVDYGVPIRESFAEDFQKETLDSWNQQGGNTNRGFIPTTPEA
jgi:hypothetical protein